MYKAKPPENILSDLRKEYRDKISISTSLEKDLQTYHAPKKQPFLVSLRGKESIFKEILSLIENAEQYIQIIITPDFSEDRDNFKIISEYLLQTQKENPTIKIEIALNLEEAEYQFMLKNLFEHGILIYKWDIGNVLPYGLYISEKSYIFTTLSVGEVPQYNTGLTIENATSEMMVGFKHLFEWNYISYYKKGKMVKFIPEDSDSDEKNASETEKVD